MPHSSTTERSTLSVTICRLVALGAALLVGGSALEIFSAQPKEAAVVAIAVVVAAGTWKVVEIILDVE